MLDSRLSAGLAHQPDSGAFTDLNRLNQFKVGADRDSEGNIKKVAQEFESLFLNQMLSAMRSANEVFAEGNFLNSNESKTYQDMHDQQLALTLSKNQGIGLADVLSRQLSKINQPRARTNPFEQVQAPQVNTAVVAQTANPEGFKRDDAQLINQRRLSLPSRLSDRITAGIVPTAETGKPLSGADWQPARSYAAPADRRLVTATQAATEEGTGRTSFASPQEFFATMMPMAEAAAKKIGVDPHYLVAQAALETGWGKSIIRDSDGSSSHNLFGIKSHSWQGESAQVTTTEYRRGEAVKERASFRVYDSFQQSFEDFVSFLQSNGRYEKALQSTANPDQFARELQQAGYATDPHYARKVSQIARKLQTYQMIAATDGGVTRS